MSIAFARIGASALLVFTASALMTAQTLLFGAMPQGKNEPPPQKKDDIRSYRFKARIIDNGGVLPFKKDAIIKGSFEYDLMAERDFIEGRRYAEYKSKRNAFSFRIGDLEFSSKGDGTVTVGANDRNEDIWIVAFDLALPKGWKMDHTFGSQSYGFILQNVPPKGSIAGPKIPARIALADFTSTREFRLDFFHGVSFPDGKAEGRTTVHSAIESIEEVKRR